MLPIICVILVYFGLFRLSFLYEKKKWNGGICPRCGEKLECFDMDSGGNRLYSCSNIYNCKGYGTSVGWNRVDQNYKRGDNR